jgi:hypothetical protein
MKKIIRIQQPDTAPFNLTWIINNICTNACSYCPANLHNGTNHNYEWANAKRFLTDLFARYPNIHCSVAGGEPSLSPFFEELVLMFKGNNSTIGITSNAAKSINYWKRISPDLNYISFSWHAEFIDAQFREKVLAAAEHTRVTVRIMMHPLHWERSLEELYWWEKNPYVLTESVRILDWGATNTDPDTWNYTDEQLEIFNTQKNRHNRAAIAHHTSLNIKNPVMCADYYFDDGSVDKGFWDVIPFINRGQTNFYGYKCEAGLRGMQVNPKGMIYLANCLSGGYIGSINKPEKIKWPTGPIICDKTICNCVSDVIVTKWLEKPEQSDEKDN